MTLDPHFRVIQGSCWGEALFSSQSPVSVGAGRECRVLTGVTLLCVSEGFIKSQVPQALPARPIVPWCCWPPSSSLIYQILVGSVKREHSHLPGEVHIRFFTFDLSIISMQEGRKGKQVGGKEETGKERREGERGMKCRRKRKKGVEDLKVGKAQI